jgi:hypothetical protein
VSAADSMQLISIVIAINALISGLFLWGVNKDRRDIKRNMNEISRHSIFVEKMTIELIELMVSKEAYDKNERGMMRKIVKTIGQGDKLKRFDKITSSKRIECKKNLQHLMLFSSDEVRCTSAHKQLVNAYGDADTLTLMDELKPIMSKNNELINSVIELRKRINSSLRSAV